MIRLEDLVLDQHNATKGACPQGSDTIKVIQLCCVLDMRVQATGKVGGEDCGVEVPPGYVCEGEGHEKGKVVKGSGNS